MVPDECKSYRRTFRYWRRFWLPLPTPILQCESKTGSSNTRQFMFSNLSIKLSNQPGFSTNASARPCAIARIVSACVSTSSLLGFGSFSFTTLTEKLPRIFTIVISSRSRSLQFWTFILSVVITPIASVCNGTVKLISLARSGVRVIAPSAISARLEIRNGTR